MPLHESTSIDTVERSYSSAEVASLFGVHRHTVLNWAAQGRIRAFNIAPKGAKPRLRFPVSSLREFMETNQITTAVNL